MSNLLLDSAPLTLCIGGAEYPIRSDYRTWIQFELLMLDDGRDDDGAVISEAIGLVFDGCPPPPELDNETVGQMMWFYRCGHPDTPLGGNGAPKQRIYDYNVDDGYIYAAFLQQYGIDLQTEAQLHWWQFYAMFISLGNCKFIDILGWRSAKISSKMSPDQRAFYRQMQKMYALPQPKNEDDKTAEINARLIRGEDVSDLL